MKIVPVSLVINCEIYKRMGECIMPREGVFAVVLEGGTIRKGDNLEIMEME